jgi:hypothetical protein
MLYQIKLQYGFLIEAGSKEQAHQKAQRMLRESPESYISDIRFPDDAKPPLWKRVAKGE